MTRKSPSASFQLKGLASKYTPVKWPVAFTYCSFVQVERKETPISTPTHSVQSPSGSMGTG